MEPPMLAMARYRWCAVRVRVSQLHAHLRSLAPACGLSHGSTAQKNESAGSASGIDIMVMLMQGYCRRDRKHHACDLASIMA